MQIEHHKLDKRGAEAVCLGKEKQTGKGQKESGGAGPTATSCCFKQVSPLGCTSGYTHIVSTPLCLQASFCPACEVMMFCYCLFTGEDTISGSLDMARN